MKKVQYEAKMVVEFEVSSEDELKMYPQGLTETALQKEMESDMFQEIFEGELKSFEAEGKVIENGRVTSTVKKVF